MKIKQLIGGITVAGVIVMSLTNCGTDTTSDSKGQTTDQVESATSAVSESMDAAKEAAENAVRVAEESMAESADAAAQAMEEMAEKVEGGQAQDQSDADKEKKSDGADPSYDVNQ